MPAPVPHRAVTPTGSGVPLSPLRRRDQARSPARTGAPAVTRRKPYTQIGIRRLKCFRAGCENRASQQWQICADDWIYRPICEPCDVDLNRWVLEWVGFPDVEGMMERYERKASDE